MGTFIDDSFEKHGLDYAYVVDGEVTMSYLDNMPSEQGLLYEDDTDADGKEARLAYLKWIRDVVFARRKPAYIVCRKFPEYGTIRKEQIHALIDALEEEVEVKGDMMDAEFLRGEAERLMQRAAIIEQLPKEDNFPDKQVLTFEKLMSGTTYSYAAVKVDGTWHVTGAKAPSGIWWPELVNFIGIGNMPTVKVVRESISLLDYMNAARKIELEAETK